MSRQVLSPFIRPPQSFHLPIYSFYPLQRWHTIVLHLEAIYKKPILQDTLQGATFSDS